MTQEQVIIWTPQPGPQTDLVTCPKANMHKLYQDAPKTRYGISATHPFYACWYNLLQRCTDPEHPSWARYGGRGITVAAEWRDFGAFQADMFSSWQKGLELDRKDNNAGYSKENCRWATRAQQCQNTENTVLTETAVKEMRFLREKGMLIKHIAKQYGISESHCSRVLRGLKWK